MAVFRIIKQAISKYSVTLVALRISVVEVDFKQTTIATSTPFVGSIQPMKPEEINLKPLEMRSFRWMQVHTLNTNLGLQTNDKIQEGNKIYIIRSINDYSKWGYIQYDITEDFSS